MKIDTSVIPKLWPVPDSIRVRLGREAGPQRAMLEDGHLLIILNHVPGPDDRGRKPALFWRSPEGEWRSSIEGAGLTGLTSLLGAYERQLTDLDTAEIQACTATEYHQVLERIAPVLRSSRGLHRALQQARELMKIERDLINFRDQAAAIERNADLLLQDAQFGMNFTVARQAETQAAAARQMATAAHRLNLLAAVFLPLTALTSVFGMEIHSTLKDTPANFALICILGVLLGAGLSWMLGRGPSRQ